MGVVVLLWGLVSQAARADKARCNWIKSHGSPGLNFDYVPLPRVDIDCMLNLMIKEMPYTANFLTLF